MAINIVEFVAAASSSSSSYTPTLPGGIIAWIICNSRRRQQIGGWLMFYYWQLYSGVFLSAVLFVIGFQSYVPESYDNPRTYYLVLAGIVPVLVIFALQLAVASMLISVRTWNLLKLLRWLILAELIAASIGLLIDIYHFPESAPLATLTVISSILWLAYFFRSKRVEHVFKSNDWEIAVDAIYPPKVGAVT